MISQDGAGSTPLHVAAQHSAAETARKLPMHGAPADAQDALGCTPLHSAASANAVEAARILLGYGAAADGVE